MRPTAEDGPPDAEGADPPRPRQEGRIPWRSTHAPLKPHCFLANSYCQKDPRPRPRPDGLSEERGWCPRPEPGPLPEGAEESLSSLLSAEQHVDIVKRQGVDVQSIREVLR